MKHLLTLLCLLIGTSTARAVQLTFRVDMGAATVPAAGVHIAGNFQAAAGYAGDWNPATTALADPDGDHVWELTVNVPAGVYSYKYVNGNAWTAGELPSADCGVNDGSGNYNRQVVVGGSTVRLPIIPFNGCATQLRFAVDMTGQTIAAGGVHVIGNFQALAGYGTNDDPNALPLRDDDGDGTYEVQISLPAAGNFQYRFVNGNNLAGAETVPAACGTANAAGTLTRVVSALAAVNSTPAFCFGSCTPCSGLPSTTYSTYWWNDAVFYEVFVRSFYDSNGDGKGDFAGLASKLDYLNDGNPATTTDLGVTALWLMPMMASPSYHGYDVSNYLATQPDYGTMAEFEAFLAAAHQRGIKVIIDLVLNHSSNQHPWFTQAASSTTNAYRDYYRWSATAPSPLTGPLGTTAWFQRNGAYYYGVFGSSLPDLNWDNTQLRNEMWGVSRFWLKKGVDGYRLDAVRYLKEDGSTLQDAPSTLTLLHEFRDSLKAVNPAALSVGEAWTTTRTVVPYVQNQRLDLCFEFDLATSILAAVNQGSATALTTQLNLVNNLYPRLQYATFLTNHDQNRAFETLSSNPDRMKQAATLYLTMPGVPFIYYGEEIGMLGTGTDEVKRRPMQWNANAQAGFTTGSPWTGINSNYALYNVATEQADATSLLSHYKKLIALRTSNETLRKGYYLPAPTSSGAVLGYARVYGNEAVLVAANLSSSAISNPTLSLSVSTLTPGTYQAVDLATNQGAGTVTVNAQGGISSWTPSLATLAGNQTWILRLRSTSLATIGAAASAFALSVYPNPAAGAARLTLAAAPAAESKLQVFDLTGRVVRTTTFTGSDYTLDTTGWVTGIYFVRVQSGTATAVQRLVVER